MTILQKGHQKERGFVIRLIKEDLERTVVTRKLKPLFLRGVGGV